MGYDKAEVYLREVIHSVNDGDQMLHMYKSWLAEILVGSAKYAEAETMARQALQTSSGGEAHMWLAMSLLKQGRREEAKGEVQATIRAFGKSISDETYDWLCKEFGLMP